MRAAAATLAVGAACATASGFELATFGVRSGATFKFVGQNDPVMIGRSTGTWHVDAAGEFGVFDGEVVNVPSSEAPGFIKAAADGSFPDASSALAGALIFEVRSSTPGYTGFRAAFAAGSVSPSYACAGGGSIPLSRGCFKAKFSVPPGQDFVQIRIPFSDFSDKWSPATGEPTTTCAQDKSVCPTASSLKGIKRFELWAEGEAGKAHLEIRSISAEVPSASPVSLAARPPAEFDTCNGPLQDGLRYGISVRTSPDIAEAVCCDSRIKVYAEPRFLYQAPEVSLYSKLEAGVTTFYDSVCGVPLFRAPMNRTLAEFKADTDEHGWPSFRPAEVVKEHVTEDKDGIVYSSCGTHLGSYLPDEKGPRWCIDLSCVAGNPKADASKLVVYYM